MALKSLINLKCTRFVFKGFACLQSTQSGIRLYSQKQSDPELEDELGLKNNPYFNKYADKIKKLQRENLDGFVSKVQELSEKKKPKAKPRFSKDIVNASANLGSRGPGKLTVKENQPSYTRSKGLDSIANVDKLRELNASEIEKLWKEYHQQKDALCAVIPVKLYVKMRERALECPNFIYPLARKHGYEFILGQFASDNCYFTQLINFQAYKEDAPVCLTLHHFTELSDDKGVVLMSGEFDTNILNPLESQFLANQVQLYYGTANLKKKLLLSTFNKEPDKFRHQEVIEELETSLTGS